MTRAVRTFAWLAALAASPALAADEKTWAFGITAYPTFVKGGSKVPQMLIP